MEIRRQYRVLQQTLAIHGMLRDRNARKAKVSEILLLICSVVFCGTTFAGAELYTALGVMPQFSRTILGIASVLAFALSLCMMILDWKGEAARHGEAVLHWSHVLSRFRESQDKEGEWPEELRSELSSAYWEAARNSVNIPAARFGILKARYLRRVQLNTLRDSYPGCPGWILLLVMMGKDTAGALRAMLFIKSNGGVKHAHDEDERAG